MELSGTPFNAENKRSICLCRPKVAPTLTVGISNITDFEKINITMEYDLFFSLNKVINFVYTFVTLMVIFRFAIQKVKDQDI